ncbi:hypothetical protein TNCV_1641891 [Trichonephila clavipes]|nr:hypothetical protein TNCV_1641891 [Trichonephila clavipes]
MKRFAREIVGEHVVFRLIEPFCNIGRNQTKKTVPWKLVKRMRSTEISYDGTKNRLKRKKVSHSYKKPTKDELSCSKIPAHDNMKVTIYQVKKNKNIKLLSNLHPTMEITSSEKATLEDVNVCISLTIDQIGKKKKN